MREARFSARTVVRLDDVRNFNEIATQRFLALANWGRELLCFFPAPMVQAQTSSHVSHPGLITGRTR